MLIFEPGKIITREEVINFIRELPDFMVPMNVCGEFESASVEVTKINDPISCDAQLERVTIVFERKFSKE